jgi:hypothetical protein
MLRGALLVTVILGGTTLFQGTGLLPRDEAWLVPGIVAIFLLFLIPESGKARDPKSLIFNLMSVIAIYGIGLKLRPWLANMIGDKLAAASSVLLVLVFSGALFVLLFAGKRVNSRIENADESSV